MKFVAQNLTAQNTGKWYEFCSGKAALQADLLYIEHQLTSLNLMHLFRVRAPTEASPFHQFQLYSSLFG